MQQQVKTKASTIEANDILDAMSQNNVPSQKQIDLLQIINYALYKKHYPQDTCGIIERKINILRQNDRETTEKENSEKNDRKRTQKVTTDILMSLLQKTGIGFASNDKAKMARLISYLTGFSEEKIRHRLSNTDELTSYHGEEIENINKIFSELNCNISIRYNKQR
jgi:hypothetical protein